MTAELNAGQRAVLDSVARRIVVSAGAGSGKTRVLAERFVDLVLQREEVGESDPIRSVLLITFTDKAAGELAERVRGLFIARGRTDLAREIDSAWISTIHGFCARIVRRHALELDVDPGFAVLADPEVGVVRTEAFERAGADLIAGVAPEVALLLDVYGVAAVRASLLRVYDSMRSKGASAGDVRAPSCTTLEHALSGLVGTLDRVMPLYRELPPTATVSGNLERFGELELSVRRLIGSADGTGAAEEAAAFVSSRGKRLGGEAMKEMTGEVNGRIADVVQAAVDVIASRDAQTFLRLLEAFEERYEKAKAAAGALDFEDLQLLTRRLWRDRPEAAARYSRQFAEVMVDEFQDTNGLQVEAIEAVAGRGLCVVGDVQQSIYRFRDADVSLFQGRQCSADEGGEGQGCRLTVNYRSDSALLATLNDLFARDSFFGDEYLHLDHEVDRPSDVVWPAGEPRVELLVVDKGDCEGGEWRPLEAAALARRIREIVDAKAAHAGDVVVLVRSTTTMRPYVDALERVGFDVVAAAAGGFYGTPEMADVRSLLRVLANPLDGQGVLELLAGGFGGLSDDALYVISRSRGDHDLWAALADAEGLGLSARDVERAVRVRRTVVGLRAAAGRIRSADAILHAASVLGGGGGGLSRPGGWANIQKAARIAAEFEQATPSDPAALLHHFDDREAFVRKESIAGTAAEGSDAIRVMTVHGAKGLEFSVVAVADLGHGPVTARDGFVLSDGDGLVLAARGPAQDREICDGATAWTSAISADRELELAESKRVFYVACTRAEQILLLSGATDLTKERGASAIDWVLAAAGAAEVPGLSVTIVEPGDALALETPMPAGQAVCEETAAESPAAGASIEPPYLYETPIAPPPEISYTALALFESCAYRFFAERMLRVGSIDARGEGDPRAFGSALHGALELQARGEHVDDERLRALARGCRMAEQDLPRLASALDAVRASAAGPLLERGRPEVPFALPVGDGVVRGSMDLVVREGGAATVLDYKTGLTWDAEGGRYQPQAEVYALALLEDGCRDVTVRFVHVEAGCEEATFSFTPSDAPQIRARICGAFSRMSEGTFPTLKAFDHALCGDCPVSGNLCRVVHPSTRGSRAS